MHHTLGWRLSIADATETDVTPVQDGLMAIQNGHFFPAHDMTLAAIYFGAAGPTRARLVTPTFRQITSPFIRPMNTDIVPGNLPGIADYRSNPLRLRALEEIQLLGTQTTGGAAVVVGVGFITDLGLGAAPSGDVYTMRGTGTTTVVAGAWSQITVTWQDTLPNGRYAIVGGVFQGTTCLAGRFILENQFWRPGGLGVSALDLNTSPIFSKGNFGNWGIFDGNRMPNVEYLCNAADTAQEFYMDIVKVG